MPEKSEPIRKSQVFKPDRSRAYGTIGLIGAAALWLAWLSSAMPEGALAQIVRIAVALLALVLGLIVLQTAMNLSAGRLSIELGETEMILRDPAEKRIARSDILGAEIEYDKRSPDAALKVVVRHLDRDSAERREERTALPFPYASDPHAIQRAITQWAPKASAVQAAALAPRRTPKILPAVPQTEAEQGPETDSEAALPKVAARSVFGLRT